MFAQTMESSPQKIEPRPKQQLSGAESTRPGRKFVPAVDIFETDAAITLLADMPGVTADELIVDLADKVLTIDGRVADVDGDNEQVLLREYETGGFHREFRVTDLIDRERINVSLNDGVLRLTLPKAEAARPRKIAIRAG